MNPIYLIALAAAILGSVTFWSLFASWRFKVLATALFFIVGGLNFFAGFELLGTAKPRRLEWRDLQDTRIMTYFWVEEVAIYVVVMRDGQPVMYQLPWQVKKAEEMFNKKPDLEKGVPMFFKDTEPDGRAEEEIKVEKPMLPPKDQRDFW